MGGGVGLKEKVEKVSATYHLGSKVYTKIDGTYYQADWDPINQCYIKGLPETRKNLVSQIKKG